MARRRLAVRLLMQLYAPGAPDDSDGHRVRGGDGHPRWISEALMKRKAYEEELKRLQTELCKLQDWIKHKGLRVVVVFEGRDAAGRAARSRRSPSALAPGSFAS